MSSDLLSGIAGAAVGFAIGGPTGALYGYSIGSAAGSILFGPKLPAQQGPRLQDLSIQSSAEGQPIFKIYGTMRTAGNVIWGKPITEHKKKKKSGGKGGGGGQTTTTYTYTADFAVGLCEGPITGIVKIWADGKLIYDVSPLTAAEQAIVDAGGFVPGALERFQASFGKTTNIADTNGTMRIYSGSETQLPDPLIEADLGAGNAPAYRGLAYIVFDNFALADFGNRIPNITAEVIVSGSTGIQYLGKIDLAKPAPVPNSAYKLKTSYIDAEKISSSYVLLDTWNSAVSGVNPLTVYPSGLKVEGVISGNYAPVVVPPKNTLLLSHKVISDRPFYAQTFDFIGGGVDRVLAYLIDGSPASLVFVGKFIVPPAEGNFSSSENRQVYVRGDYIYLYFNGKLFKAPLKYGANSTTEIHSPTDFDIYAEKIAEYTGYSIRDIFITEDKLYLLNVVSSMIDELITFDLGSTAELSRVTVPSVYATTAAYLYIDSINDAYIVYRHGSPLLSLMRVSGSVIYDYGDIPNSSVSWVDDVNYNNQVFAVEGGVFVSVVSYNIAEPSAYYWALSSIASTAVPLSTIVADICNSAGLDSSFINVTDLAGTNVRGYTRNAQMTARAALEPLASGFFFDAVESADKIVFKHRGSASVATIDYDDLGASSESSQADRVITTITQDNELPIELNMQYTDPARDFQVGSQRSRRQVPKSQKIDTVQMPISWSGTEAKQAVEKLHYTAWEDRTTYAFSLPAKHMRLEPTDVVMLPVNGVSKRVRITKTVFDDVLKCEAVADYSANYVGESIAADNPAGPQQISVPGTTIMQILDIPILQDGDNDAGFYVAAMGTGSGWSGAVIYKSSDNVSFDEADSVTVESTMGSATTLLPSGPTTIWDDGSTVTVRLIDGALTSTTDLGAMAGINTIAIGAPGRWEIVSFRTATLNADGTYTLSRLLRGRLGTEWAVGTHEIGDTVVLLEAGALIRIVPATSDIGVERYYKAISFGGDDADSIAYTHRAVGLETHAPVHIAGRRHSPATNDWTITWVRRGRVDNTWRDYVDVPLGETTESYEIDIMSGSTVKRTLTATSQTVTYTSAMQTTDFGAVQTTITVNVYQLSGIVGRGFVGAKTL